jgi:hypothetical protein
MKEELGILTPEANVLVEMKHTANIQDINRQIISSKLVINLELVGPYVRRSRSLHTLTYRFLYIHFTDILWMLWLISETNAMYTTNPHTTPILTDTACELV